MGSPLGHWPEPPQRLVWARDQILKMDSPPGHWPEPRKKLVWAREHVGIGTGTGIGTGPGTGNGKKFPGGGLPGRGNVGRPGGSILEGTRGGQGPYRAKIQVHVVFWTFPWSLPIRINS